MTQVSLGKLRWRCRRGTKELDKMFSDFLDNEYAQASKEMQQGFVLLLEQQDPDVYDWLMGAAVPEERALLAVVKRMRERCGF